MEWMIIEKFINILWLNLIKEKGITGKRKKKLLGYDADQIIEALNLSGKINSEYELIMNMKNKRNKFIHRGVRIIKEDAEEGFKISSEVASNYLVNLGLLKKSK